MNQNLTDLLFLSLSLHIAHRYPRIPSTPKHYSASDNTPAALQHQEETPTETKCLSISSVLLHSLVNVIHMPLQCFPLLYTQADSCNSHSMYREQGMNYSGWFLQWWQYIQKTGHEILQLIAKMVTVHRENRAQTTQADSCDSHTQYTERTGHKLLRLIPVTVTHSTQREQAKLLRLIPVTVTHSTQREQGMNYSGWFLWQSHTVHRENRAWTTQADSCNGDSTQRDTKVQSLRVALSQKTKCSKQVPTFLAWPQVPVLLVVLTNADQNLTTKLTDCGIAHTRQLKNNTEYS